MNECLMPSLVVGVLMVALQACGPDPVPTRQPGLTPEEAAKLPAAAPTPEPVAPPAAPPAFQDLPSSLAPAKPKSTTGSDTVAAVGADGQPASPDAKPADEKAKRDLGGELRTALGQPTDCLDLQKVVDDGGKILVRVAAYVGPSGRITRATVTAPGQALQALSCIERRTVAIKMKDPVEDAPRLVETELSFQIARNQAAPPTAPPPAPAAPPSY